MDTSIKPLKPLKELSTVRSLTLPKELEADKAVKKAPLAEQPEKDVVAPKEKTEPKAEPNKPVDKPVEKSVDNIIQLGPKPAQAPVKTKQVAKVEPKPEQKKVTKPQPAVKAAKPAAEPVKTGGGSNSTGLTKYIAKYTGHETANHYVNLAVQNGKQYGIDPLWLIAMMETESTFNKNAVSSDGARGLMQFLPSTAKGLGVGNPSQLHDPSTSVRLSATYLSDLTKRTGSLKMATIAYNQGIGNVQRGTYKTWYYDKVLAKHQNLKALSR
ncbi:transglycosylase SLT domain-containing protein [Solibacillus silvestris]